MSEKRGSRESLLNLQKTFQNHGSSFYGIGGYKNIRYHCENCIKLLQSNFLVILLLLIVDQLAKQIILMNLKPGDSIAVIRNVFHISLVCNRGAAFGIFSSQGSIFIWVSFTSIIAIILIFTFLERIFRREKSTQIFLSLILAGAIGNLVDRLRFGFVIDFLDFRIWPVFNIADSAITIGTILLILQMLRRKAVVSHKS